MNGENTLTDEGFDLPPYSREQIWKLENRKLANLSKLVMISHHGTHVDVPFHMIPNGKKLDEYLMCQETRTPASEPNNEGKIVFVSPGCCGLTIYVMDTDGSNRHNLTNDPSRDEW